MDKIILSLDNIKPPSVNALYNKSKYGHIYKCKKAKDFEKKVKDKFKNGNFILCSKVPIKLYIEFNLKCNVKKIDLDNMLKITLDSLNGLLYVDDSLIFELQCIKTFNNESDSIKVIMEKIEQV